MSVAIVTGGAGFIGSHAVDALLEKGFYVRVIDNLSSGKTEFLEHHKDNPNLEFIKADLLNDDISEYFRNCDVVFHFAANRDIKRGMSERGIDIQQNIVVTQKILDEMVKNSVKKIFFASTSSVYGEASLMPTPENYSPMEPVSLYGASKLACEALLSSYHHSFGITAFSFRLANIIGERSDHGVVFDFVSKLKKNPQELAILGNGEQKKSYLYVKDVISAMMLVKNKIDKGFEVFNLGSEDHITVKRIAQIVSEEMSLKPKYFFTGGDRGWLGDIPVMLLDVSKIKSLGWKATFDSEGAVRKAVNYYLENGLP